MHSYLAATGKTTYDIVKGAKGGFAILLSVHGTAWKNGAVQPLTELMSCCCHVASAVQCLVKRRAGNQPAVQHLHTSDRLCYAMAFFAAATQS